MELSNEQRFNQIVWAIRAVTELSEKITNTDYTADCTKLKKLCNDLWPAFLGGRSNGSFWLMGSSWNCSTMQDSSLLLSAFSKHRDDLIQSDNDYLSNDDEDEIEYDDSREAKKWTSEITQLHELFIDSSKGDVVQIWMYMEQLVYALHRYDDDFSKRASKLSDLAARINGELFDIIQKDSTFYRTWLLKNLLDVCIDPWGDDIVSRWFRGNHLYHNIKNDEIPLQELQDAYFELQGKKVWGICAEKRLLIVLCILGHHFRYNHQHKDLIKLLEEHNKTSTDDLVDLKNVQEVLDWCITQKKIQDDGYKTSYTQYCLLSQKEL